MNNKIIEKTTENLNSKLSYLKTTRKATIAITDKAMSTLTVDIIPQGDVESLTIFNISGDIEQAMISTVSGAYTTCSKVVVSLVAELIDLINSGEVNIDDIGFQFMVVTSKSGNKYIGVDLL